MPPILNFFNFLFGVVLGSIIYPLKSLLVNFVTGSHAILRAIYNAFVLPGKLGNSTPAKINWAILFLPLSLALTAPIFGTICLAAASVMILFGLCIFFFDGIISGFQIGLTGIFKTALTEWDYFNSFMDEKDKKLNHCGLRLLAALETAIELNAPPQEEIRQTISSSPIETQETTALNSPPIGSFSGSNHRFFYTCRSASSDNPLSTLPVTLFYPAA